MSENVSYTLFAAVSLQGAVLGVIKRCGALVVCGADLPQDVLSQISPSGLDDVSMIHHRKSVGKNEILVKKTGEH